MSWEKILKKEGFEVWTKGEEKGQISSSDKYKRWNKIPMVFPTREEALEELRRSGIRNANPKAWTPQGDQYVGRFVVLDRGFFEDISAPSYKYVILPVGEKPDDRINPSKIHDFYGKEATRRKLEGKNPVPETSSRFKEDNK